MSSTHRTSYDDPAGGLVVSGFIGFAGIMLATVAVFQILEGISAIADDKVYVTGINYAFQFDVTTWGWIHLIIGIIAFATGVGLMAGQTWAGIMGIAIAVIGSVANFAFLPYYPFWSVAILAFNVFVIWAICVQIGRSA